MPYIPTTITHKASGAIYAYKQSVSGGSAQPDGVKSITAGYGVGGGGNTGAVALSNAGITTITGGAGVSVTTSGDVTTLTATGAGATSGTSVRYVTNLNSPVTFLPSASTILCTLETPTTNNYAEVSVGFVPAQTNPYVQPVLVPSFGAIGLGIYLSPAPVLTPTIISNCYGSLIAETSAISNIPFTLPGITGQSTYPANALYLSAVSPTPVSTWYVVASNFQASGTPYIGADTCQEIRCGLYANNVVVV
jgi:hypothetical protein